MPSRPEGGPLPIDAFGEGGFRIGGERHEGAVWLLRDRVSPFTGPVEPKALAPQHLQAVLDAPEAPDILVMGVGERLRHPPASVRAALRDAGVGLEAMDTPAACRAYNLLAGEARRVFALLLPV